LIIFGSIYYTTFTSLTHKALILNGGRGYIGQARPGQARPSSGYKDGSNAVGASTYDNDRDFKFCTRVGHAKS